MMHLNNSIRYKRSFVNINPQSNTDFTQVTCTVHYYYSQNALRVCNIKSLYHNKRLLTMPQLIARNQAKLQNGYWCSGFPVGLKLCCHYFWTFWKEIYWHCRMTERQRDKKTGRQKNRETERQRDRKTERQKDRKTESRKNLHET